MGHVSGTAAGDRPFIWLVDVRRDIRQAADKGNTRRRKRLGDSKRRQSEIRTIGKERCGDGTVGSTDSTASMKVWRR